MIHMKYHTGQGSKREVALRHAIGTDVSVKVSVDA
jgi:hypothetical protein